MNSRPSFGRKSFTCGVCFWLLAIMAICLGGPPGVMRTSVTLQWDYPTNALSTNLWFKLYSSTNLTTPTTNWPHIATVVGTNLTVTLPIDANQRFYVMTASNWWGESVFSNVAATPALPHSDVNLRIQGL